MSPDTIVPDPFDGQSFNRYSYVTNNPLSLIDPSGHEGGQTGRDVTPQSQPVPDGPPCWGCYGPGVMDDSNGLPVPTGYGAYSISENGHTTYCNSDGCLQNALDNIVDANSALGIQTEIVQHYPGLIGVTFENPNASQSDPVAVVGGLFDSTGGAGSAETYEGQLEKLNPSLNIKFFSWTQAAEGALQDWFDSLSDNMPVTVIGQSLGGWQAAVAAMANPGTIDTLITIDPVSEGWAPSFIQDMAFQRIENSVGTWIDVSQNPSGLQYVQGFGFITIWGSGPNGIADVYVPTNLPHADIRDTMSLLQNDGYLPSGLNWVH